MAQQGKADEALTAAFTGDFFDRRAARRSGRDFLAPVVAGFALRFGPAEFFAVQLLTFCSFVGMGREAPFKVLAAMMLRVCACGCGWIQ